MKTNTDNFSGLHDNNFIVTRNSQIHPSKSNEQIKNREKNKTSNCIATTRNEFSNKKGSKNKVKKLDDLFIKEHSHDIYGNNISYKNIDRNVRNTRTTNSRRNQGL